jgi:tetratricopeptide (TPR) repeat protein
MFDGRLVYRLHVALTDGYEKEVFVDAQSFLILGERRSAPIHAFGQTVASEIHYSEYRPVNGILFPSLEQEIEIATGRELNRESIESVVVNDARLSPRSFAPPQESPTAFQLFLEQLYMERTDPISVIYTYQDFRTARPDVNTRDGIEFIGYQMTKMGDYQGAIEILKANAADYPKAASAQYSLGRAYKAAGKINNAQEAFQRALQIDPNFKKARDGLNALR